MIKLYHYSNTDFKGYIKPLYFGNNTFTGNSQKLSGVKRIYFYLDKDKREYYLKGSKFLYIAEIKESQLYNLNTDNQGIVKRLKYNQDIYTEVKKRSCKGLIGNNGFNCVVLFYKIKIKDCKTLTKY